MISLIRNKTGGLCLGHQGASYLTYWWGSRPRRHPQSLLRHLGTYQAEHTAKTELITKGILHMHEYQSQLQCPNLSSNDVFCVHS